MMIYVVKFKIYRVKVIGVDFNYIGSIIIDEDLMDVVNIIEGEKVQIVNNNNGECFEIYVIFGFRKSGEIMFNGVVVRKVVLGDILIFIIYVIMNVEEVKKFKFFLVFLNEKNNFLI